MDTAANERSGPNVTRATLGNDRAQYKEPEVCGRKKTGPRVNANTATR
jgi:hypothetical protein